VSATGQRKWVRAQCRVELHEGRPVRLRGTFQDITLYKEAEEALNAQSRALSMLAERERLARELHDSLGQMLAYVSVQAQAAGDLIAQGRVAVGLSSIEAVAQIAGEAQAEMRAFLRGTKAELGGRGFPTEDLVTAIRRLLDGLRESQPIQAELVAPAERKLGPFSPVARLHLLRIVEEALVNVRRHAAAGRVTVTIERDGDGLRVEVADDGRGFEVAGAGDGQGYGLEAMRSRARDAGGRLQISSGPGGTRVVVWVPLTQGRASAA
jgi:signal transduction histidine kinase